MTSELNCLQSSPKATACSPSMLRMQHLKDVTRSAFQNCDTQLPSLLQQLVISLAPYLAGGNLVALMKIKEGGEWDVRPIAVGEVLHRFTHKWLCSVTKIKASQFFHPHQYGVECPGGSETIVHRLCSCTENCLGNGDFVTLKIDLLTVSQGSCFWMSARSICYNPDPLLWHTSGMLHSADGVQQGDPIGPVLFALVLHKLVKKLDAEFGAGSLLNVWFDVRPDYLSSADIHGDGPLLGLHLNLAKCELLSPQSFNVLTEHTFPFQIILISQIWKCLVLPSVI